MGVVVWVDGRKGARGTAETGSLLSGSAQVRQSGAKQAAPIAGERRRGGRASPDAASAVLRHREFQPTKTVIYKVSCLIC